MSHLDETRKIPSLSFTSPDGRTPTRKLHPPVPPPVRVPTELDDERDDVVDEVYEAAAEAMYARSMRGRHNATPWERLNPRDRNEWREDATFVIAAIARKVSRT